MGRFQQLTNSPTSQMDIDPHMSSWNSLTPSFVYTSKNHSHLEKDICDQVIGSPPPKSPPKRLWQEEVSFDGMNNNESPNAQSTMASTSPGTVTNGVSSNHSDTQELALRVQEMQLQQEPLIICENVDDEKLDGDDDISSDSDSLTLTVPSVDIADERKRPPY